MTLLMRPEPFARDLNRLVNTLFDPVNGQAERWVPAMDLVEGDDHFVLKADLPGLSEEDVNIEFENGVLTISGERHEELEQKERGWYRVERSFGSFSRSLTLPEGVNADSITASFNKGVLEVQIPKPEERKPRRIAVRGNGRAIEGTAEEK